MEETKPQRTTAITGVLLVVAGIGVLPVLLDLSLPLLDDFVVPLTGPVFLLLRALVLALAFAVLAFGAPGERGVGGSLPGTIALLLFGIRDLVIGLVGLIPYEPRTSPLDLLAQPLFWEGVAISLLTVVTGVVAAVAVVRARVLPGAARWALLPFIALRLLMTAANWTPGLLPLITAFDLSAWLEVATLLLAGGVLLGAGRREAVRDRLAVIRDAW